MAKTESRDDLFDEKNEVPSNWLGFNKVGDWFKGTLTRRELVDDKLKAAQNPGAKQWVYEFKVMDGEFHKLDASKAVVEPGIRVKNGEFWQLGSKESIDKQMRNIKIGQVVGMKLAEIQPAKTKGFNPFKLVKVYAGPMDDSFMADEVVTIEDEDAPPFIK